MFNQHLAKTPAKSQKNIVIARINQLLVQKVQKNIDFCKNGGIFYRTNYVLKKWISITMNNAPIEFAPRRYVFDVFFSNFFVHRMIYSSLISRSRGVAD